MTSIPDLSQLDPDQQIKRNLIARPDLRPGVLLPPVVPPPPSTQGVQGSQMPDPAPPVVAQPNISPAQSRVDFLRSQPSSGIAGLHPKSTIGKIGKGALQGLDFLGSTLAPGIAANIPGTTMHHNVLEAQAERQLGADVANQQKEAQTNAVNAEAQTAQQREAETERHNRAVENAPLAHEKPVTITMGDKTYEHDPQTDTWKPIGPAAQKATPQEHAQAGVANGKPAFAILTPQGYIDANTRQPLPDFHPAPNYAQVAPELRGLTNVFVPTPSGQPQLVQARPGQVLPEGTVTPQQYGSTQVPTQTIRTQAQNAQQMVRLIDKITPLIDGLDKKGELGPMAGRYNEFLRGRIGTSDPDYTFLKTLNDLSQTLALQAHMGSRGAVQILDKFQGMIDAGKMDAPTLKAAYAAARLYFDDRAHSGNIKGYGEQNGQQNQVAPKDFGPAPAGSTEGRTGKLPDGTAVIVKNGRLVAQ